MKPSCSQKMAWATVHTVIPKYDIAQSEAKPHANADSTPSYDNT